MTTAVPLDALREFARFAETLADAARPCTLTRFRTRNDVENKSAHGFDPVTEADRAAETALRALIGETYPDHGVEGEEWPDKPGRSPWTWLLDPIDGTRAYIIGAPTWTTLIGLAYEGRPVLGVIDQPFTDERWLGFADQAWRTHRGERRRLAVRPCARLSDAVMAATDPFAMFNPAEMGGFRLLQDAARLSRFGLDAYGYALLAEGGVDLVVEAGLKPFDICALVPIIEAAGGRVSDWSGRREPAWRGGRIIAAGDPRVHEEALPVLQRALA